MGGRDSMTKAEAEGLLGLGERYTREELRRRHRALMKECHPDARPARIGGGDILAKRLNRAFDCLEAEFESSGEESLDPSIPGYEDEISDLIAEIAEAAAEAERLRRENERLRKDNEILSMAYSAGTGRPPPIMGSFFEDRVGKTASQAGRSAPDRPQRSEDAGVGRPDPAPPDAAGVGFLRLIAVLALGAAGYALATAIGGVDIMELLERLGPFSIIPAVAVVLVFGALIGPPSP